MHDFFKKLVGCAAVLLTVNAPALHVTAESGEGLSRVQIIGTQESQEIRTAQTRQKQTLDAYDDFSLISYQTVENPQNKAVLVSDSTRNDIVVSSDPTPSVVDADSIPEGTFAFSTYGWGHCVGLSQNGSNFYAIYGGWNYQDILFHYYPGTVLMNTGTAETEMITVQGVPGNALQQVAEIVNREVGGSFNTEAIKAQAVAVYSYIKYYQNDSHDLKGKPDPPQNVIDACASVLGEALYYNGSYAMTMFGASCGGITADSMDIFDMNLPYLRSVSSDYDAQYDPHYGDVVYYTIDEVRNIIEAAYHIRLSDNPENWIQLTLGNGGYVTKVIIDGQLTVRGDAFRYELNLKSPKFTYVCSIPEEEPEEEISEAQETASGQEEFADAEQSLPDDVPMQ